MKCLWGMGLDCGQQIAHGRRRVVSGKHTVILRVKISQTCGTLCCRAPVLHVVLGRDSFAGASVQTAALAFSFFRAHECSLMLIMQNEPKLETGIGNSETDPVLIGQLDGPLEVRVIFRPLHIEDTPALIHLILATSLNRSLHQRQRDAPPGVDFDAYRSIGANLRKPFKGIYVVRLGRFAFTEYDHRFTFRTVGVLPLQDLRLVSPQRHPASRSTQGHAIPRFDRHPVARRIFRGDTLSLCSEIFLRAHRRTRPVLPVGSCHLLFSRSTRPHLCSDG